MPAWIGILLSAVGLLFSSYEFAKKNPEILPARATTQQTQPQIMYSQINIAYDTKSQKHWYQHLDGQWREFPPRP